MNRHPALIRADALAALAVRQMDERKINQLLVVDADGLLVGAVHIHDLLAAKVA